jgi:hypothetical protein
MEAGMQSIVDLDQVDGIPLTQHVRSMAGHPIGRAVHRHPASASQGEAHHPAIGHGRNMYKERGLPTQGEGAGLPSDPFSDR